MVLKSNPAAHRHLSVVLFDDRWFDVLRIASCLMPFAYFLSAFILVLLLPTTFLTRLPQQLHTSQGNQDVKARSYQSILHLSPLTDRDS